MPKTRRAVESESKVSVTDQILSQLDELENSVTSEDDLKNQIQIIREACQQKLLNWRYNSLTDKVKKIVKDSEFYKNAELKTLLNKLTVVTAKSLSSDYDAYFRTEKTIKFGPKLDVSLFCRGASDGVDDRYIVSINGEEIFDGDADELTMEVLTEDADDKDDEDEEESDKDEENDAMTVEEKSPVETKKLKAYFQQKAGTVSSPLLRAYYQLELQTVPKDMFFKFVLYILQDVMEGAMHWSSRDAVMS